MEEPPLRAVGKRGKGAAFTTPFPLSGVSSPGCPLSVAGRSSFRETRVKIADVTDFLVELVGGKQIGERVDKIVVRHAGKEVGHNVVGVMNVRLDEPLLGVPVKIAYHRAV